MTKKHKDYCTFLKNDDDKDILTRRLFDVNMRLFRVNDDYKAIVQRISAYIRWCALTEKEGYKKPHGYSGANAGFPFNIIALANGLVMLNPYIVSASGNREGLSNCGSLLLEKPIKIRRFANITVNYFDLSGYPCVIRGYLPTVQHEIDHNNGILITDRVAEQ